jgi:hypothetical protein
MAIGGSSKLNQLYLAFPENKTMMKSVGIGFQPEMKITKDLKIYNLERNPRHDIRQSIEKVSRLSPKLSL